MTTGETPDRESLGSDASETTRHWCVLALWIAIGMYVVYVSYHSILNHYSLGTSAYDLGIMENVFWNSVNGELFRSSIEDAGNHLGVHTSFIFLPFFPLYALFQRPETLLILQTLAIAMAAWPLFLLAESMLGDAPKALLVSGIYLSHPAIGGANFYDFHELAFTPLLLFSAFLFMTRNKFGPYWLSIVLLLAVKEDMALVVVAIGVVIVGSRKYRLGTATVAMGIVSFVILQFAVIPHFAGGHHDYGWYYKDMGGEAGGIGGILTTVIKHPVYTLKFALVPPKLLYIFQLFAPLAFLAFASWRGVILVSYGLLASLLASREPLFQLGFQYPLTTVSCALVGMLFTLAPRSKKTKGWALAVAVLLAVVVCIQYGMIYPRHNFAGGFRIMDFDFTDDERAQYHDVKAIAALIPDDASVTAGETLVPHIARRKTLQTTRFALTGHGRQNDYYFVLNSTARTDLRGYGEVTSQRNYELVAKNDSCSLFRRRPE